MNSWLKEPLIHFLLLGVLIFVFYDAVSGKGSAPNEIFISRGQQENLLNTFSRTWQRPPTPEEFQALLQDYIRQEIAYRESTNMGLDQNDIVIRRRLRQKLELLAEDMATLTPPDDAQLQEYLDQHKDEFLLEPRISLKQIYFSPDRRGETAERDATELLRRMSAPFSVDNPGQYGDPIPLPDAIRDMRESEVARLFGNVFSDALRGLEAGKWSGPVASGFGFHLVYIESRVPGRLPDLNEVRELVQRDWISQRGRETIEGLYDRLAENYTIEVEPLVDIGNPGNP